jgi:hypothetical protein
VPLESKSGQKLLDEQIACSERNTAEEIQACRDKAVDQFEIILSGSDRLIARAETGYEMKGDHAVAFCLPGQK